MTTSNSILIVEDEADLAELLRFNLAREGYACRVAPDGERALALAGQEWPDLVVLDRMLPGLSGDDVIGRLRSTERGSQVRVLMLTAKAEEGDQLVGFALGADDYVTKPFAMKLMLARVAALLRRPELAAEPPDTLALGPVRIDVSRHEVWVADQKVDLTPMEFRILRALMAGGGRVRSRPSLIEEVVGGDVVMTARTMDVHVTALRRKLGLAAAWVQTIRGVGYAFREPGG